MAERTFVDPAGRQWTAWDVVPGEHTAGGRVRGVHLPDDMAAGWLAFDGPEGKRRIYPIPPGWDAGSDAELWALYGEAEPVVRRGGASRE